MSLFQGQILNNRYRIVKQLGQGGFGAVYRAWDVNVNIAVALKENFETSPEAQRQFAREATLLASLRHPNLPRVSDHFVISGQGQYLVMDFIEGEDCQTLLDRQGGPLPEAQVLKWLEQVCDALTYLHKQTPPVVHRDLKPANIHITPQGQAVLVDFGLAKIYDPQSKTTRGARAVTPGFSPLEQYGQGITDVRTDIYALGATVYALVTGQVPPESTQRAIVDTLVPPRKANAQISLALEAALVRALQVDPSQRFSTVAEFQQALKALDGWLSTGDLFPASPGLRRNSLLLPPSSLIISSGEIRNGKYANVLRWTLSPTPPADYLIVRRYSAFPKNYTDGQILQIVRKSDTYADEEPAAGEKAYYAVYATWQNSVSSLSAQAEADLRLGEVANLQAHQQIRPFQVRLTWQPPTGVHSIVVRRSIDSPPIVTSQGEDVTVLDQTHAIDKNVPHHTTIYYSVFCRFKEQASGGSFRTSRGQTVKMITK